MFHWRSEKSRLSDSDVLPDRQNTLRRPKMTCKKVKVILKQTHRGVTEHLSPPRCSTCDGAPAGRLLSRRSR